MNARPLMFTLPQLLPEAEIVVDFPSRLADGLADGRFDVALIPSIEYLRQPGLADRLRRGHRLRRPGAKRQALRPRADRAGGNARLGRRLADQRGPGPDPAPRAFRFEAAPAALAAGEQAGRLSGRCGGRHRRPRHAGAGRGPGLRLGPGRGVVALDGPALCLRPVGRSAARAGSADRSRPGRRPR